MPQTRRSRICPLADAPYSQCDARSRSRDEACDCLSLLTDTRIEAKSSHDDGWLWVVMLHSQSNQLVEGLGSERGRSYERPQQLVRGRPARTEDGSLLVVVVDSVCRKAVCELFGEYLPLVGGTAELREPTMKSCHHGQFILLANCSDLILWSYISICSLAVLY